MRIGFDIDGVLADFNTPFSAIFRNLGYKIPHVSDSYPNEWNYITGAGVPADVNNTIWQLAGSVPEFWANLPPTEFGEETLKYLYERFGNTVTFITSRPGYFAQKVAQGWLANHGYAANPRVFVAKDHNAKREIAQREKLDFFIDDKPENVGALEDVVPYTAILDRPWNRHYVNELSVRCSNPIEAVEWAMEGLNRSNAWGV